MNKTGKTRTHIAYACALAQTVPLLSRRLVTMGSAKIQLFRTVMVAKIGCTLCKIGVSK